jgi:hypothetical protein
LGEGVEVAVESTITTTSGISKGGVVRNLLKEIQDGIDGILIRP